MRTPAASDAFLHALVQRRTSYTEEARKLLPGSYAACSTFGRSTMRSARAVVLLLALLGGAAAKGAVSLVNVPVRCTPSNNDGVAPLGPPSPHTTSSPLPPGPAPERGPALVQYSYPPPTPNATLPPNNTNDPYFRHRPRRHHRPKRKRRPLPRRRRRPRRPM